MAKLEPTSAGDEKRRETVVAEGPEPEPRWPAFVAALAVGGIYMALPSTMIVGPRWIFPSLVLALLIPAFLFHKASMHRMNAIFGYLVEGVLTAGLIISLILLIRALPAHQEAPAELLVSAAMLWVSNILVFALWYWRLDAGGPNRRDKRITHKNGAFLFPQMTLDDYAACDGGARWSPNFIDYLFLAFNTSTAFSPTDAPVLARWAKVLMMLQSLLSLMIIALLAARAVNIL